MQICINCTEEFYKGDTCPTCGSKDIVTERAEKNMYMKTKPTKKFKCKKCGYTTLTEEKITCCPKCKWNVGVVGQFVKDLN